MRNLKSRPAVRVSAPQQSHIDLSLHQGIGEFGRGFRGDRNVDISRLVAQIRNAPDNQITSCPGKKPSPKPAL